MLNQSIFSTLFSSFKVNGLSIPNRIVMAPMTRGLSPNNTPSYEVAKYYRRRAEGGTGLIITECTYIDHPAANSFVDAPAFHGEEALSGWRRVVEEVHAAGGKIVPQIWHAGPGREIGAASSEGVLSVGPMDVFEDGNQAVIGMSLSQIREVVELFGKAAAKAKAIGFDGVEIHGAHGYLIDSFLWHETNQRDDAYGGSIENRARFACDVVSSVRSAVGSDFPISFRFSQWKLKDYDAQIAKNVHELERLLVPLAAAGVDIFHVSTRRYWQPAFAGSGRTLAGWTKKITGKPVIAVGSVGVDKQFSLDMFSQDVPLNPESVDRIEYMLDGGEFDLIAVGRALLADANWANKIRSNDLKSIVPFSSKYLTTLS
jgi:2,4-dienoyl-CoA reductase-like NADH-dependent reductase (Old Yellow Enzyme family)